MPGLIALAVGYILSQFYRACLAVMTPVLSKDLGATPEDMARASGAWFLIFALMQFPVGAMLGRLGPRRTAAVLLAIGGGTGALLFSRATTPGEVAVAMGLIGVGCSPVYMASLYIYARQFPPARFALMSSTLLGVGAAGNLVSAKPLAWAMEAFGWRGVWIGLLVVTLAVAGVIWAFVKDPPPEEGKGAGLKGFIDILGIRALWPMIPLYLVSYAVVAGIRGLWAGPYLREVYGADAAAIGGATFFMAIMMTIGSFAYGPLDRVFGGQKPVVLIGCALTAAGCAALAMSVDAGFARSGWILAFIGLVGMSFAAHMAHGRRFLPPHLIGQGVTFLNFCSIGGVGLAQALTGRLVEAAGRPHDAAGAYGTLFAVYAGALALATVIYAFSKPRPEGQS